MRRDLFSWLFNLVVSIEDHNTELCSYKLERTGKEVLVA